MRQETHGREANPQFACKEHSNKPSHCPTAHPEVRIAPETGVAHETEPRQD